METKQKSLLDPTLPKPGSESILRDGDYLIYQGSWLQDTDQWHDPLVIRAYAPFGKSEFTLPDDPHEAVKWWSGHSPETHDIKWVAAPGARNRDSYGDAGPRYRKREVAILQRAQGVFAGYLMLEPMLAGIEASVATTKKTESFIWE